MARINRITLVFFLMGALASMSLADTVRLKNGSIIKGRISSFGNGTFTVVMGEGSRQRQLTFTAAEVDSITFDQSSASPVPQLRTAQTRPTADPEPPRDTVTIKNDQSAEPKVSDAPTLVNDQANTPRQTPTTANVGPAKPISWDIKVLADATSNGWTNSGWVVKKGQRIKIVGDGSITLGKGQTSTASGLYNLEDPQKLLKNVPTGALIAVIGDDNNDFIYIGSEREFTATRDGALFLGINEGKLEDNSGSFSVKIEILPDSKGN